MSRLVLVPLGLRVRTRVQPAVVGEAGVLPPKGRIIQCWERVASTPPSVLGVRAGVSTARRRMRTSFKQVLLLSVDSASFKIVIQGDIGLRGVSGLALTVNRYSRQGGPV